MTSPSLLRVCALAVLLASPDCQLANADSVGEIGAAEAVATLMLPNDAEIDSARNAAAAQLAAVDRWLGAGANGDAWRDYLDLPRLQELVANAGAEDADALDEKLRAYYEDQRGLESKEITAARAAVRAFVNQLRAAASADEAKDHFIKAVELASSDLATDADTRRQLADELRWLESRSLASDFVARTLASVSQPNLHASVDKAIIEAMVDQPDPRPVTERDNVDGARVRSNGTAFVNVTVDVSPSAHEGRLLLRSAMLMPLRTTASKGPATVFMRSSTTLQGQTQVLLTPDGFFTSPTGSTGGTCTGVCGARTKFRGPLDKLVSKVAQNAARKELGSANRDITQRAQEQLHDEIDQEVAEEFDELWEEYQRELRLPLKRRDLWPRQIDISGSGGALNITVAADAAGNLGATGPAPELNRTASLSVRLHESIAERFGEGYLAGDLVSLSDLEDQLSNLQGEEDEPEEAEEPAEEDREGVEVRLANRRPVQVRFEDQRLIVTIHGTEFRTFERRGGQRIVTPYPAMVIEMTFLLDKSPTAIIARREGEPVVTPVAKGMGGLRGIAVKNRLRRQIMRDVPAEISIVDLPLVLKSGERIAGRLGVTRLLTQAGWLILDADLL